MHKAGAGGGIALFTLAGLMIASLAGALTALAITLAPNPFALSEIVLWLNGALTDRSWREVAIAAPLVAAGIAVLALAARSLDALTLGEEAARSLGLDPVRLLGLLVVGVGLTVGRGRGGGGDHRLCRAGRSPSGAPADRPVAVQPDPSERAGRCLPGARRRQHRAHPAAGHRAQARHRAVR